MFYVRSPLSCASPPRANNNSTWPESGGFEVDLRHHAVLETLSAADNISGQFGPRSGPTKYLKFLLIRLCGAQVDLRLRWSHTTKSGYIHLQTCGKESKFWNVSIISRSSKNPSIVKLLSWKKDKLWTMESRIDHLKVFPVFKFTAT